MSTDASRPILSGIHIEKRAIGACVVATNGKTLAAHLIPQSANDEVVYGPDRDVILSADWRLLKSVKAPFSDVTFTQDADGSWTGKAQTRKGSVLVAAYEVEGPYPSWRHVVPRGDAVPLTAIGLDLEELAPLFKSFGVCSLQFSGESRAVVVRPKHNANLVGVWMPYRTGDDAPIGAPSWSQFAPTVAPTEAEDAETKAA